MKKSKRHKFVIVAASWHKKYVDAMIASAQKILVGHKVEVIRVPGSMEIPLAVAALAKDKKWDALIALGVVWHGDTDHGTLILQSATAKLMQISCRYGIPVIHEILGVKTQKHLEERTIGKLDRGAEAGRAALDMVQAMSQIRKLSRK
jgi:6,7-dimethyl-8-ribityllumazine synthase